ncbi:MAG: hypothetical protein SVV80_02650 [Planctomycetota bacterium]|nr:hypothetical protein [Planctomycetota bacterium]
MRTTTVMSAILPVVILASASVCPGADAGEPKRLVLPEHLSMPFITAPNGALYSWADIESKFKAGDPYIRGWVE